jgi:hypothetical protein
MAYNNDDDVGIEVLSMESQLLGSPKILLSRKNKEMELMHFGPQNLGGGELH